MLQLTYAQTATQLESFRNARGMPSLNAALMKRQQADTHLLITDEAGAAQARCSLWWKDTPPDPEHRLGLIGHYAAVDAEAARELLQQACAKAAAHGCTQLVGPMDGNTWQQYRLVTERGSEPPFFLEPYNPAEWPEHFLANGFTPLAEYYSALTTDLSLRNPRMNEVAERMHALGGVIRPLQTDSFNQEMARIYAVSEISFQQNFLYTPISREDFIAQYEPVRPYVRPELALIAEHENRPVGFIFCLPDLNQAQRGQAIDTVIIKTVAVLPEKRYAGLGGLLVARSHEIAQAMGFRRAIHALMHETNKSRSISGHYADTMRRYTLFARALTD
jgi:GNAT superfamily N-acetyltransferase